MTAHEELKEAIFTKLTAAGDFNTNIGGRVYYGIADQPIVYPCCVYSFYADNHSFDSGNKWEEIFIQFSMFSNDSSSAGVTTLESNLIDLLDGAILSFPSFVQIQLKRLSKRYLIDSNKVWNSIVEYRIEMEHN